MLIKTVTANAEKMLLATIEDKNSALTARSLLQCCFSTLNISAPDVDRLVITLKDMLKEHNGVLYYCSDGDVFIEWAGAGKGLKTAIEGEMAKYCLQQKAEWNPDDFFRYYDINVHGEELRIIIKHKIAKLITEEFKIIPEANKLNTHDIKLTSDQQISFYKSVQARYGREMPHILIVEDQAFSRKLLLGLLLNTHKCHVAKDAAEALAMYSTFVPDIILLDVELPDANGHSIAKCIREIDPDIWIVMVTANHYQSDVNMAKENKVQGFIVKPYNKQKIMGLIDSYNKLKKQG